MQENKNLNLNQANKKASFKECLKPTKFKVLLLIIYLILYLFIISYFTYNSYLMGNPECHLEGSCIPSYISYVDFIIYLLSELFIDLVFIKLSLILLNIFIFLIFSYFINAGICYFYLRLKEVFLENEKSD